MRATITRDGLTRSVPAHTVTHWQRRGWTIDGPAADPTPDESPAADGEVTTDPPTPEDQADPVDVFSTPDTLDLEE